MKKKKKSAAPPLPAWLMAGLEVCVSDWDGRFARHDSARLESDNRKLRVPAPRGREDSGKINSIITPGPCEEGSNRTNPFMHPAGSLSPGDGGNTVIMLAGGTQTLGFPLPAHPSPFSPLVWPEHRPMDASPEIVATLNPPPPSVPLVFIYRCPGRLVSQLAPG